MTGRALNRLQPLGLLVLRCVTGAIMIAHGYPKVVHHGVAGTAHTVSGWGWPWWLGYVAAWTEFLGGMLLAAGLLTRLMAAAICCEMMIVIWKIHWARGFTGAGSAEFPLALAAITFALIWFGGGLLSVDHLIFGGGHKIGR